MTSQLEKKRSLSEVHHFLQAIFWLEQSEEGSNTTALSYAAFELRLQLERLMLSYWKQVHDHAGSPKDISQISKLDNMRRSIREIFGGQEKINRHFQFSQVLSEMVIGLPLPPNIPDLGKLQSHWSYCSDLCHVSWTLDAQQKEIASDAHARLVVIHDWLKANLSNGSWPMINPQGTAGVPYRKFMDGEISIDEAKRQLRVGGIWAKIDRPDGTSEFLGNAIPPEVPNS